MKYLNNHKWWLDMTGCIFDDLLGFKNPMRFGLILAVVRMILAVCVITVFASGCATMELWRDTGWSTIEISRIVVPHDGEEHRAAQIVGERFEWLIPCLWRTSYTGIVDELVLPDSGPDRLVFVERAVEGEKDDMVVIMPEKIWLDSDTFQVRDFDNSAFLITNWFKMDEYLIVPVQKHRLTEDRERWKVRVLREPRMGYEQRTYGRHAVNWKNVFPRVVLTPLTVAFDVVTLPLQYLIGVFVHM